MTSDEIKLRIPCVQHIAVESQEPNAYVYFLLRDNCVVYVGQTTSKDVRFAYHCNDVSKDFDTIYFYEVPVSERFAIERKWIEEIKPEYNYPSRYGRYGRYRHETLSEERRRYSEEKQAALSDVRELSKQDDAKEFSDKTLLSVGASAAMVGILANAGIRTIGEFRSAKFPDVLSIRDVGEHRWKSVNALIEKACCK